MGGALKTKAEKLFDVLVDVGDVLFPCVVVVDPMK